MLPSMDRGTDVHELPRYEDEAARRVLITSLLMDRDETSQVPPAESLLVDWDRLEQMCLSASERAREQGRRTDEAHWLILNSLSLVRYSNEVDSGGKDRSKSEQAMQAALNIFAELNQVRHCRDWAMVLEPVREAMAKREEAIFRAVLSSMDAVVSAPIVEDIDNLSPREAEVLGLVADGLKNQQIADTLFISLATVKRHIANIYAKMGVSSRTEAIREAVGRGWMK